MVPLTDFLTGVLSALILYAVLKPFLNRPRPAVDRDQTREQDEPAETPPATPQESTLVETAERIG